MPVNEEFSLFVECCDLSIKDGYVVDNDIVDKTVLTVMPKQFDPTTCWCGEHDTSISKPVCVV